VAEDALAELWQRAKGTDSPRGRAADCVLVALTEAALAARDPARLAVAAALGRDAGPATVPGLDRRVAVVDGVAANGYLVHAGLADDAYALAGHPGAVVVPAALAEAEARAAAGRALLDAVLAGYEAAGLLADVLLPRLAEVGWRLASVSAPVAAAATVARIAGHDDATAASALRIAASAGGGTLETVAGRGDDWQVQPALAAAAGVAAARAAEGGLAGTVGMLEGVHGLYARTCGGPWPGWPAEREPRITAVTFKRFGAATYAQAVYAAIELMPPLAGDVERVSLRVPPFAAGYGGGHAAGERSPASLVSIAARALALLRPGGRLRPGAIEVEADATLGPLAAHVEIVADGRTYEASGDGDTAGWTSADVDERCSARLGARGAELVRAVRALDGASGVTAVAEAWRAAV
jgi:2-methylcitrate dehydratase PrpD